MLGYCGFLWSIFVTFCKTLEAGLANFFAVIYQILHFKNMWVSLPSSNQCFQLWVKKCPKNQIGLINIKWTNCTQNVVERPDPGLGSGYPGPKSDLDPWAGPGSKMGPNLIKNCRFLAIFWVKIYPFSQLFHNISNHIGTYYTLALG